MSDLQTLIYYFPNYHVDKRNEAIHGNGWTEWELMKHATPRFPGHDQPKVPLWGYEDEADPGVMSKKIDLAAEYGHNAFIFDWYWYDGPYLQRALDEGFLGCGNTKLKFALMWANHDWTNFHPGNRIGEHPLNFPWTTTPESIGFVWDYIIERYLTHPLYFRMKDGRPYFLIYATPRFIQQMGGVEGAKGALDLLREKAVKAGLPGVWIGAQWSDNLDAEPSQPCRTADWHDKIGFDSYSSYNMLIYAILLARKNPERFPGFRMNYNDILDSYLPSCRKAQQTLPAPYFPEVTIGWDSTPRTIQSDRYQLGRYPYFRVWEPREGELYHATLKMGETLKEFPKDSDRLLFFNAWNEWTEGSYLEPDQKNGFRYLEEIKKALEELRCK